MIANIVVLGWAPPLYVAHLRKRRKTKFLLGWNEISNIYLITVSCPEKLFNRLILKIQIFENWPFSESTSLPKAAFDGKPTDSKQCSMRAGPNTEKRKRKVNVLNLGSYDWHSDNYKGNMLIAHLWKLNICTFQTPSL